MADTKISEMAPCVSPAATNQIPIAQSGINQVLTLGQVKQFTKSLSSGSSTGGALVLLDLMRVSGVCTLPAGTSGQRVLFITTGSGTMNGAISGGNFAFPIGITFELIWSDAWYVVGNAGALTPS